MACSCIVPWLVAILSLLTTSQVCFGSAFQELVVYRCRGSRPIHVQSSNSSGGRSHVSGDGAQSDREGSAFAASVDPSYREPMDSSPPEGTSFESFFQLLYRTTVSACTQSPRGPPSSTIAGHGPLGAGSPGAHVMPGPPQTGPLSLNKDFALFPLWGEGGRPLILLATQTPPVPEGRQQQQQQLHGQGDPAAAPAVTVVPYVEQTMLHLVGGKTWAWCLPWSERFGTWVNGCTCSNSGT
eukprot:1146327-Pelagomonas_calceolata.AAC.4